MPRARGSGRPAMASCFPDLGKTLWPGDQWRCITCLESHLSGKDATTKSMHKMLEYGEGIQEAFEEAKGLSADQDLNGAEWARMMAAEIRKQGMARSKDVTVGNGEAVSPSTEKFLHDTLTIPDLAAVEASFDRSRLLVQNGADVAAMGLDAAQSIQATNSLESF